MTRRFEDWVDVEGLTAGERARLERLHDVLLNVGPPAELPHDLSTPAPPAQVIQFPTGRRRGAVALVAVAAVVAASFVGGFFVGHVNHGMEVARTASLQSPGGGRAFASLEVGERYNSGNYPIEMTVQGLPKQMNERSYYLLLLWRNGKPAGICGAFRVENGVTKLHFDVPYDITSSTRWAITEVKPGLRYPGTVMMKTV